MGRQQWATLCCWITLHTNWLQSAREYFCFGSTTRAHAKHSNGHVSLPHVLTLSLALTKDRRHSPLLHFVPSICGGTYGRDTYSRTFARAKQCLEARRHSRAGAVWRWGGIHAGHKPIDVRVGKTKGGGVSAELQPAVSLRKAAGFLRRRGITPAPLSCVPEETWA